MSGPAAGILPTHEVTNQPPPLASVNLFDADTALVEAVRRSGAAGAEQHLTRSGKLAGDERVQDLAASPTAISRSCGRSIGLAIATTRSNFTRLITN